MSVHRKRAMRERTYKANFPGGTRAAVFEDFPIKVYVPLDSCHFSMEQFFGNHSRTKKSPMMPGGVIGRNKKRGIDTSFHTGKRSSAKAGTKDIASCFFQDSGRFHTPRTTAHVGLSDAKEENKKFSVKGQMVAPVTQGISHERLEHNGFVPNLKNVEAAIESLYLDELKPCGRILRKRIAEHAVKTSHAKGGVLPDVDIDLLRGICTKCPLFQIENEEGGDWSVQMVGRTPTFIDVYDPDDDVYPQELWSAATAYFKGLEGDDMHLPGGRYLCAHMLKERDLPFLAGYSLGQICHIVQLALSKRKLLGYRNGSVVPYGHSQSMVKDNCAVWMRPTVPAGAPMLPLATWDMARDCLRKILESMRSSSGPGAVPLSNVKRLFRSRFHIELSETMLGHAKLSDLLQSVGFHDVCEVHLEGNGYIVVQAMQPHDDAATKPTDIGADAATRDGASADYSADGEKEQQPIKVRCRPPPLMLEAQSSSTPTVPHAVAPISTNNGCASGKFWLDSKGSAASEEFHPQSSLTPLAPAFQFPPTPSPLPTPAAYHPQLSALSRELSTPMKVMLYRRASVEPPDFLAAKCSPVAALREHRLGTGNVRNTFIDGGPPPLTPQAGMRRRSRSLPKDVGSHTHAWDVPVCDYILPPQSDEGKCGSGNISNDTFLPSLQFSSDLCEISASHKPLSSPELHQWPVKDGDAIFASSTVPILHLSEFV